MKIENEVIHILLQYLEKNLVPGVILHSRDLDVNLDPLQVSYHLEYLTKTGHISASITKVNRNTPTPSIVLITDIEPLGHALLQKFPKQDSL